MNPFGARSGGKLNENEFGRRSSVELGKGVHNEVNKKYNESCEEKASIWVKSVRATFGIGAVRQRGLGAMLAGNAQALGHALNIPFDASRITDPAKGTIHGIYNAAYG
jgi:hypothetical protein